MAESVPVSRWISILGAIMSACYATIAFVASLLHEEPETGVSYSIRPGSQTDQVFAALNALGTIMFAFGGHAILLEIQVGPSGSMSNRFAASVLGLASTQHRIPGSSF